MKCLKGAFIFPLFARLREHQLESLVLLPKPSHGLGVFRRVGVVEVDYRYHHFEELSPDAIRGEFPETAEEIVASLVAKYGKAYR